jgi:predicted ATPase
VDREHELEVVRGLLDRTSHRAVPHLVTIFGEPGVGKTRFVMEFERRTTGRPGAARFVVCRIPPYADGEPHLPLGELVRALCDVGEGEPTARVRVKLAAGVRRVARSEAQARWLVSRLSPLVGVAAEVVGEAAGDDVADAVRLMLTGVAADHPLVVVVDDLHHADDALLTFVDGLPEVVGAVPLLVMAVARPELLERWPEWGGGKRHATAITLDPLSDAAIDQIMEFVIPGGGADVREPGGRLRLQPEIVA